MAKVPTIYDIDLYQPNWSAKTLILTGNSADTAHYKTSATVENIGYVYISLRGATASKWVHINGEPLGVAWTAGGYERPFFMLAPVKNGDVIEISSNDNDTFTASKLATAKQNIYFVPITRVVKPNENCVSYVVETGHNQDSTAFYRKYSDGYIEQYGKILLDQSGTTTVTVTLPTQFASSNYIVTLGMTGRNNGGATPMQECNVNDLTEGTFELRYYLTGVASGSSHYIFYRACGY